MEIHVGDEDKTTTLKQGVGKIPPPPTNEKGHVHFGHPFHQTATESKGTDSERLKPAEMAGMDFSFIPILRRIQGKNFDCVKSPHSV